MFDVAESWKILPVGLPSVGFVLLAYDGFVLDAAAFIDEALGFRVRVGETISFCCALLFSRSLFIILNFDEK